MSEPNSGSDLAGTRTRAVKVDGGFRINGSKLWTSNAHRADYMILFCKMAEAGQEEVDRHAGATQFLVDLKNSPGIEIRPVINLLGEHHFNQIFLTDLFVPDNRLFGEVGNGWRQVSSELAFERSGPDRFLVLFKLLVEMVRVAGPNPGSRNRGGARPAGRAACDAAPHVAVDRRHAAGRPAAAEPRPRSPRTSAHATSRICRWWRANCSRPSRSWRLWIHMYPCWRARTMNAPRLSIQGGTREILRGIIARGLGLR